MLDAPRSYDYWGIYLLLYNKITGFTYLLVEAEKGIIWGDQPG